MTRLLYIPSYLLNPLGSCATTRVDLLATSFSAESRTKRRLHRRTSCTGMRTTRRTKIINNLVFRVTCTKGLTEGFDRNSRALEDGTAIGCTIRIRVVATCGRVLFEETRTARSLGVATTTTNTTTTSTSACDTRAWSVVVQERTAAAQAPQLFNTLPD